MRKPGIERQGGDRPAMPGYPSISVDRPQLLEPPARLGNRGLGRRIEQRQPRRVGLAPHQAGQQQPGQVGFEDFGRIVCGKRSGRGFLP